MNRASDTQVGGDHYKKLGEHQPWDVLQTWLTPEEYRGWQKGTAIVYLAREKSKGGDQDIQKALHHLQRLTETFGTPLVPADWIVGEWNKTHGINPFAPRADAPAALPDTQFQFRLDGGGESSWVPVSTASVYDWALINAVRTRVKA